MSSRRLLPLHVLDVLPLLELSLEPVDQHVDLFEKLLVEVVASSFHLLNLVMNTLP